MTYKTISNRLRAAIRRAYAETETGWVRRRYSGDLSKLSDRMLRDIGLRREGDWIDFEARF
ncbi:hypothetical protein [Roseobacter sinensis]|uniref:DUF1127 domain-containing protein n=1 Tax=Roseobacter sinensis TaxID=2931391 RepID=A0ABT3BKW6_9RHOB|nr:hypothetical protein [Roseobacter sp. WL0113]MCV3274217.1 hypothetical protein [Roseobacter sp. WL0113]